MADDGVGKGRLEAAVDHQRDAGVDEGHAELDLGSLRRLWTENFKGLNPYHLQDRQISLPPEVLSDLGSQSGEAVVAMIWII